jgi:hypothetical protein
VSRPKTGHIAHGYGGKGLERGPARDRRRRAGRPRPPARWSLGYPNRVSAALDLAAIATAHGSWLT